MTASMVANRATTSMTADVGSGLYITNPNVVPWLKKTKRTDTPFQKIISYGAAPKEPHVKYVFGQSEPDSLSDQLNGALDASQTNVTVDDASKFQVGHTFAIESEGFLCVALNETTNVLTVAPRPYWGSAATHADNMAIRIQSPAIAENQATPLSPWTQGGVDYNYFQQIEKSVQLSHRAKLIGTIETLSLKMNDQEQARLRKLMEDTIPTELENSLLYGGRTLGVGALPSSMGGLLTTSSYITTINTSLSGPLTLGNLMSNMQTASNLVGSEKVGKTAMAHPAVCEIIGSFWEATRRTSGQDTTIKTYFTKIDTGWFGEMTLYPNYMMLKSAANGLVPDDKVVFFNPDDLKIIPLSGDSGFSTAPLPEDGWFSKMAIRGDVTLDAQNPDSRILLGGFSTTRSDYPSLA